MQTIESLSNRLVSYLDSDQITLVRRAYYYAEQAHDGQNRRSGEPYVTHPLAVAGILSTMHMDHQSLMAAMLHDVIEDTGIPKDALENQFGESVAELVDGVSKLTQIEFGSQEEKQAENFQKMALAMANDIRVILVKLADRLHNMRTLGALRPDKMRRIAKETLEIYAPIAHRLGMNDMRIEFENRGFSAMYPLRALRLQAALHTARGNRKELVENIQSAIEHRLERENIPSLVLGREKHLYSIYQKMRQKKKSFKEIMDVYAFRIIVEDVDTCYRVLGLMHNLYKPVIGEFKDYIAIPKANGYQSLHSVLVGMHGVPIEVQIRTKEMDELANTGIAAHWLYKAEEDNPASSQARARQWIAGLLEIQQQAGNSLEFIENVKIDLFPDEVYVFTPKGKIISLPAGATAVDFAYAVHTDVGHRCVACRINERLAPLSQALKSGEKVKVITSASAQPNPAWLNFTTSGKARSAIRHYLKNQRHHESMELGQRLLNRALSNLGLRVDELTAEQSSHLLTETHMTNMEALLEDIGLGNRLAHGVGNILKAHSDPDAVISPTQIYSPLMIDSTDAMLTSFARCCRPIPGDMIIGHLSAGKGLVVHRDTCKNIAELRSSPENISQVHWAPDVKGEFLVNIKVEVESEPGMIASLANRIAEGNGHIERINVDERDSHNSVIELCIGVTNRVHLADIMRRVRIMRAVIKLVRSKN